MRSDERTVKYRRTLWKGRPCHASVLPFVTIRPVKTRAAANHGSQYDTEKNNGGCGRPSEDPRREKRLQYPEFGRCRGHGSFRGRRQREDTKWVLAISRDSINLFFFFPLPLPLRNVPRKACWRAILHDRVRTLSFSYYTYEHTIQNMMLACKHETRWKGISNSNIPPPILDRNVCLALRCQNSRPSWSIPRGGHFSCQRSERDRETIDERRTF